ncbi:hypothetical protein MHYP_G00329900 [Metynnis hypsauchen]
MSPCLLKDMQQLNTLKQGFGQHRPLFPFLNAKQQKKHRERKNQVMRRKVVCVCAHKPLSGCGWSHCADPLASLTEQLRKTQNPTHEVEAGEIPREPLRLHPPSDAVVYPTWAPGLLECFSQHFHPELKWSVAADEADHLSVLHQAGRASPPL